MKRFLALVPLAVTALDAQCVMCFRTAAAQQMERARVLNFGIIIMLIPPAAIMGGFLYLLWRRNKMYAEGPTEPAASVPPENTPSLVTK